MDAALKNKLEIFATEIRIEAMNEFGELGFGHVGGSLSVADALAVLYGDVLKIDPKNPAWPERDYVVMSKGHAGPALYATLALKGYFPMEWLKTLNKPGTNLPSHCDKNKTPGIDMTTGSLGQGASTAIGMALGLKLDGKPNKVNLFVGDGESNEGQVWEGALFAAQHKPSNLTLFMDYNKKQLDGDTKEVIDLGDVVAKFDSFGFYAQEVDGNCVEEIYEAIQRTKTNTEKPNCIVLNTVKGAGVKEIEGVKLNHHITISKEQAASALAELNERLAILKGGVK